MKNNNTKGVVTQQQNSKNQTSKTDVALLFTTCPGIEK